MDPHVEKQAVGQIGTPSCSLPAPLEGMHGVPAQQAASQAAAVGACAVFPLSLLCQGFWLAAPESVLATGLSRAAGVSSSDPHQSVAFALLIF